MNRKRVLIMSIVVVFAIAALVAVTNRNQPQTKERAVRLQLEWKPGAEHAFLYLGLARGVFKARGIDLEIVPGQGSVHSANMIDAQNADFALCSGEVALQSFGTGRRVQMLAVFYPNTPAVIYSLKEKGIESPIDLYAKRLGVIKGSAAFKQYEAFAEKVGLERSKIQEIACAGSIPEILADNARLDAMVQYEFQQPLQLELQGHELNLIRFREHGLTIYGQGLITNPTFAKSEPDLTRLVVECIVDSLDYAIKHPDAALEHFCETFPEQDREYSFAKLKWVNEFIQSGQVQQHRLGYQRLEQWQETQDFLLHQEQISTTTDLSAFYTNRFLPPVGSIP
jgi:NitT/TauT family transport system substrate-binding protein